MEAIVALMVPVALMIVWGMALGFAALLQWILDPVGVINGIAPMYIGIGFVWAITITCSVAFSMDDVCTPRIVLRTAKSIRDFMLYLGFVPVLARIIHGSGPVPLSWMAGSAAIAALTWAAMKYAQSKQIRRTVGNKTKSRSIIH